MLTGVRSAEYTSNYYGSTNVGSSSLGGTTGFTRSVISPKTNFNEIVGNSAPLRRLLQKIETVSPTDATVLITGETGTGKELIARAVHRLSRRSSRTFVKVNSAAIPANLIESELFGHERGAFTGAINQRVGRFEIANGGTLFLDEIGDLPLELQPKLLRVLQEQEFERLGSSKTIKTNVRMVAATNQDLLDRVEDGEFRSDLFYRLNVFPVRMPALRERRDDIPLLAEYFAQKFATKMGKELYSISAEAHKVLQDYDYPGNIRELENVIERAVILATDGRLRAEHLELTASPKMHIQRGAGTLEHLERNFILETLGNTNWRIGGAGGAADKLGLKRTTLLSRMEKLGINRQRA